MSVIEIKVPDIGDFSDVDVIEVLVKAGDTVAVDDALITLESDKASMDIPSSAAGTVKEMKITVGGKASEGTVICLLEVAGAAAAASVPAPAAPAPAPKAAPAPAGASYKGKADVSCQMLVLGAGPGGYTAAFRAADLATTFRLYGAMTGMGPSVEATAWPFYSPAGVWLLLAALLAFAWLLPNTAEIMKPAVAPLTTPGYPAVEPVGRAAGWTMGLGFHPSGGWALAIALLLSLSLIGVGNGGAFIYYQF